MCTGSRGIFGWGEGRFGPTLPEGCHSTDQNAANDLMAAVGPNRKCQVLAACARGTADAAVAKISVLQRGLKTRRLSYLSRRRSQIKADTIV